MLLIVLVSSFGDSFKQKVIEIVFGVKGGVVVMRNKYQELVIVVIRKVDWINWNELNNLSCLSQYLL